MHTWVHGKHLLMAALMAAPLAILADVVPAACKQGPTSSKSETVARPRKKGEPAEQAEQPKIPTKFGKKEETEHSRRPADLQERRQRGAVGCRRDRQQRPLHPEHSARQLPRAGGRCSAADQRFNMGEAPMTVCMVIEFSNLFQQYWGETWYQTLTASYGFLETLKPEDYVAVVAYDLRPEILSDFSTDKRKATKRCSACGSPRTRNRTSMTLWWTRPSGCRRSKDGRLSF